MIFMKETYSSLEYIKIWKIEWGGKRVSCHGSSHSGRVKISCKPRLNIDFQKVTLDNFGRVFLAKTIIDKPKIVLANIYAPNDETQ